MPLEQYDKVEKVAHEKGKPAKQLAGALVERKAAEAYLDHIRRHFDHSPLESDFLPNRYFQDFEGLMKFLHEACGELIPAEELMQSHIITLEFDEDIGENRVTQIREKESVRKVARGKNIVNVVHREGEEVPRTNLLTFQAKPLFDREGPVPERVPFEITNAFPGPITPPMRDTNFWGKHAFIARIPAK